MVSMRTKENIYQGILYVVVGLLVLMMAFPLVYVIGQSFVSESEWIESGGKVIIPSQPTLYVYKTLFTESSALLQAFKISVLRTVLCTAVSLFFTITLGYVLSRKNLPFGKVILFLLMITILFDGGLIPTFLVIVNTKVYNTFFVYFITSLVSSWNALVFRQFFLNIPASLEESARLDGASEMQIMWRIVLPMSMPVIAALSLFTAVGQWNSWFDAAVYIRDDALKPFQLILRNMFVNPDLQYQMQNGAGMVTLDPRKRFTPQSLRMAITVIGTVPILCVYPFLQKYFIKGVYMGAVKE